MNWAADEHGSAALTTILLMPLLLLSLVSALELGALRVATLRVRAAADLATLVAIDDQQEGFADGVFRPSADAESVVREYLALNLAPLARSLGETPEQLAAEADVAVFFEAGGVDPRGGRRYDRPAVRVALRVPVRTPAFGALLLGAVTPVDVFSASVAR